MKFTGNQALAAVSAIFFVLLFGYMWSVERREPSPIVAASPAVVEAPPTKRVKARPLVTDPFAGKPRNDSEDSYTAALKDGFLRAAAQREARKASAARSASTTPTSAPAVATPASSSTIASSVPSTTTPVEVTPPVATPAVEPDSKRTQRLAASSRRIGRLCERVKDAEDFEPAPSGGFTSSVEGRGGERAWEAVLAEATKVAAYYSADVNGTWKGLAANDYLLRIVRTADRTCDSTELAAAIFDVIDQSAKLLDPEALDRMIDEALRDLD